MAVFDLVQSVQNIPNIANTTISILLGAVVPGNTIIVSVFCYSETSPPTMSDGINTYTEVNPAGGAATSLHTYYAANIAAGTPTLTSTYTTSVPPGHMSIWATEYEGNLVWDVGSAQVLSSTTIYDSGVTGATSHADELLYGVHGSSGGSSSVPSGWTNRFLDIGDGLFVFMSYADEVVSSTGTQQYNGSCLTGFSWTSINTFYQFSGGVTNPSRLSVLGVG